MRSGKLKLFNSIGVIGLLVTAAVLMTTVTSPANAWRDPLVEQYAPSHPDIRLTARQPGMPYHESATRR